MPGFLHITRGEGIRLIADARKARHEHFVDAQIFAYAAGILSAALFFLILSSIAALAFNGVDRLNVYPLPSETTDTLLLPPARFDYEPRGYVIVHGTLDETQERCFHEGVTSRADQEVIACATRETKRDHVAGIDGDAGTCYVYMPSDLASTQDWSKDHEEHFWKLLLRHELAHCNGWRHEF